MPLFPAPAECGFSSFLKFFLFFIVQEVYICVILSCNAAKCTLNLPDMKRILLILTLAMLVPSCKQLNPFLGDWNTPYGIPDFESIKESDYIPAVKFGIRQQEGQIDAIIANGNAPDFENTVAAYELSGEILDRVTGVLFNLSESDATPSMQKIVERVIPMLTEHNDNVFMNPYFFARVDELYQDRANQNLTREQEMTLEKLHRAFIDNGVNLDPQSQERLRAINKELAVLEQRFGNNVLDRTNAFRMVLADTSEIAGLPSSVLASAAAEAAHAGITARDAAREKGIREQDVAEGGPWLFTLHNASYVPFMTNSSRRDLREKMFTAYSTRCNTGGDTDNKPVVLDIIRLRIEKANLLGYDTPAAQILSDKMAHDPQTVDSFLEKIFPAAVRQARSEIEDMQAIMDKDVEAGLLPADSTSVIRPWDWAYYAEKVRQEKYALNEDLVKPYFKMENVREGVFNTAHRLYGLNFRQLDSIPLYHPDVEGFEVTDSDGSLIGILLTDYYTRSTKRGGAWMNNVRNQYKTKKGEDIRPIIVNVANFPKPSAGMPSLLSIDEVGTMFHEFGHALHGLLSQCTYKDVSGTGVARDFVELPSQINENWAFLPEVLKSYAHHYSTGEAIPDSLITKISVSKNFNQGFMTTELVAAAVLDMKWHELKSVYVPQDCPYASETDAPADSTDLNKGLKVIDPDKFEAFVMAQAGLPEEIIPRYRTTYFNHVFSGGYSAGYYGYLWAEVLDKDAFELFRKKGEFDSATARSFRENILEKGGSEEPMVLYRRFRGADPDPDALLRARGLK